MNGVYDPRNWYWTVADDEAQVYASARGCMVAADDAAFKAWCLAGKVPTRIAGMADLIAVLRGAGVPPYHRVSTYRIVRRLEEAGKADAAEAVLAGNKTLWRRFYSVGEINGDDPDARAFLSAIGAEPAVILAPEAN